MLQINSHFEQATTTLQQWNPISKLAYQTRNSHKTFSQINDGNNETIYPSSDVVVVVVAVVAIVLHFSVHNQWLFSLFAPRFVMFCEIAIKMLFLFSFLKRALSHAFTVIITFFPSSLHPALSLSLRSFCGATILFSKMNLAQNTSLQQSATRLFLAKQN